jgi:hypothetical protein
MENWFRQLFKSPASDRDKFLARLFGLFSEEIVRVWCKAPWSPYCDLGRPRVTPPRGEKGYTLDFTLQSRKDGSIYVAEMKCWVEYQGYQYLTLRNADQLGVMEGPAFNAFLEAARSPSSCTVSVNGSPQTISGAILIWGDVEDSGRTAIKRAHKIAHVLSLKDIIDQLVSRKHQPYLELLRERLGWCEHLFHGLAKD